MGYNKFVEIGRVVHINFGDDKGKLAVIIDVLNERRVLIDGPTLGVDRQLIPVKRVGLTKFKIPILRNPRFGNLKKAIEDFGLKKKWEETSLAKKIAIRTRRATLTDFERFKAVLLRKQYSKKVRTEANKVGLGGKPAEKKETKKEPKKDSKKK